ncbi:MAG: hypothetical protein Q3965_04795 [Rothia sp. (in: high G+C Gram-positive bacteria)]|nr:hypothetical protein [Rothia sp. (in: high G+C Gram-positive bacteria)]
MNQDLGESPIITKQILNQSGIPDKFAQEILFSENEAQFQKGITSTSIALNNQNIQAENIDQFSPTSTPQEIDTILTSINS